MRTLEGLRVVDVGTRVATAWCSRLLADFGADVVAIEPVDGHPVRRHAPFDSSGRSIAARYVLANKRRAAPTNRSDLLSAADVIVADAAAESIQAAHPTAIVVGITPGGLSGPFASIPGNDLTAYARSSWAQVNGRKQREPLKGSGYQASYQAGTMAFGAVVAALIERSASATGDGQLIDISELDVLVSTSAPAPLRYQYSGFVWDRRETVSMNDGPIPVADGFFALPLSRPAFWEKAMNLLGLPDLAADEDLQQPGIRVKYTERFADRVSAAMRRWKKMDLFYALAELRVIAGPALEIDEMAKNPQFEARGFFQAAKDTGTRFPGPFAKMGLTTSSIDREMDDAPRDIGTFDATGLTTRAAHRAVAPDMPAANHPGPLAGFRGLVLTQAWAGTYATELLAMLGADVIQLETTGRLDSWRGTYRNPIPKHLETVETAEHAWNCNPLYNSVNLNKRCITVDLSEPEGVDLFKSLVIHADFVAENFSPRVMGNLGIDYATLTALKEDLVMASLSAYGAVGPWANVPGIGGTIEPSSGMSSLLGYAGEEPQNSGQMYPDPVAGICGFSAIALALLHRDRTGEGQYIDLSMQEANFNFIGDAWLEYEINGDVRGPQGNRHPSHAPHNFYRTTGDDAWIAISAETDEQFIAIADALDLSGFGDAADRKARESELDAAIAAVTESRDAFELEDELIGRGVPAAALRSSRDVAEDVGLRRRGHMVRVDHPETGPVWQSGCPMSFSRTPGAVRSPAPCLGQHSAEVFAELLGIDAARYEQLKAIGVTGK